MTKVQTTDQLPRDRATGLTLPLSRSLGSQDLAKHRAMVALDLEVLAKKFDRFGWDRDRNTPAHDRLILDWMEALEDYPLDEIRAACRAVVLESPKRMPNEGDVVAKILAARKIAVAAYKARLPKPQERGVPSMDPEAVAKRAAFAAGVLRQFPSNRGAA